MTSARRKNQKQSAPGLSLHAPAEKPARNADGGTRRSLGVLAPAAAVVLIIGGGMVHGLQTNRWKAKANMREAVERMKQIPTSIGDWEGRDVELDERQLKRAGAEHALHRVYRNRTNGKSVEVLMLVGDPGPISLHPPTVCFQGAGWTISRDPTETPVLAGEQNLGQFRTAGFARRQEERTLQAQVWWSWCAADEWSAPTHPRFAFASADRLFKLYVLAPDDGPAVPDRMTVIDGSNPCHSFLRDFLPALRKAEIF